MTPWPRDCVGFGGAPTRRPAPGCRLLSPWRPLVPGLRWPWPGVPVPKQPPRCPRPGPVSPPSSHRGSRARRRPVGGTELYFGPQLAASTESIQARSSVTRAYTPGMEVEQLLLPHETMPTRVQAPSFWHTSGPPESPCGQRGEAGGRSKGNRGWGWGSGPVATYHAGGGSVSAGAHHHVVDAEPPVLLALRVGEQGQGHLLQHRRRRVGCERARRRQRHHVPRDGTGRGTGTGTGTRYRRRR